MRARLAERSEWLQPRLFDRRKLGLQPVELGALTEGAVARYGCRVRSHR
jgi:hypothetical protein